MQVRVVKKPTENHWCEAGAIYEVSDGGLFWVLSIDKLGTVGAMRVVNKSCCEIVDKVKK